MEYSILCSFFVDMIRNNADHHLDSKENFFKDIQIVMNGNSSILIENYKSIMFCSQCEFMIKGYRQKVHIIGENLSILFFNEYRLTIEGHIKTIQLVTIE